MATPCTKRFIRNTAALEKVPCRTQPRPFTRCREDRRRRDRTCQPLDHGLDQIRAVLQCSTGNKDRPVQYCPAKPDRWARRLRGKNMTRPITKAAKVELAIEDEDGNCCYSYDGDAGDPASSVNNAFDAARLRATDRRRRKARRARRRRMRLAKQRRPSLAPVRCLFLGR